MLSLEGLYPLTDSLLFLVYLPRLTASFFFPAQLAHHGPLLGLQGYRKPRDQLHGRRRNVSTGALWLNPGVSPAVCRLNLCFVLRLQALSLCITLNFPFPMMYRFLS